MVAHRRVIFLPKLQMQFAEFLQDSSLKRLGMLYHPTCVGFGYGLYVDAISWISITANTNPIRIDRLRLPSHSTGSRILT